MSNKCTEFNHNPSYFRQTFNTLLRKHTIATLKLKKKGLPPAAHIYY